MGCWLKYLAQTSENIPLYIRLSKLSNQIMYLMRNLISKLWSLPNENGFVRGTKDNSIAGYITFVNQVQIQSGGGGGAGGPDPTWKITSYIVIWVSLGN